MRPTEEIEGCKTAHAALKERLHGLSEATLRQPSLLPGWDVAHVLAHIGRNGDSVTHRLKGAINDEVVDQYAGGPEGRAAEIEESAALPADDLLAYVCASNDELDQTMDRVPDDAWERQSRSVGGELRPARMVLFSRWREVEVHHVDLGLGYRAADWPPALVDRWLPSVLRDLPERADSAELLAWGIGRGPAPELGPWG